MRVIFWTVTLALLAVFFGGQAKAGQLTYEEVRDRLIQVSGVKGAVVIISETKEAQAWYPENIVYINRSIFKYCNKDMECVGWQIAHELVHLQYKDVGSSHMFIEKRADKYAPYLMKKAGLNPKKGIIYLRKMQQLYGNSWYPSHPDYSDRIKYLQNWGN